MILNFDLAIAAAFIVCGGLVVTWLIVMRRVW